MQRKLLIAIVLLATVLAFNGCQKEAEPVEMNVGFLPGPTALTAMQLAHDNPSFGEKVTVNYKLVASTNVIMGELTAESLDFAVVPTNQTAILYNKGIEYQIAAPSMWGAIYLLGTEEIAEVKDLAGKEIALIGKGLTPDILLRYILQMNDLNPDEDVTLTYLSSPQELLQSVVSNRFSLSVVPEPLATTAMVKNPNVKRVVDFQEEWKDSTGKESYPMSSLIVRKAFAEENPELVADFLEKYKASVAWANENPEDLGTYSEEFELGLPAAIVQKSVGACNLKYMPISEVKQEVKDYFDTLFEINPDSLGGKIPDDNIYYNADK